MRASVTLRSCRKSTPIGEPVGVSAFPGAGAAPRVRPEEGGSAWSSRSASARRPVGPTGSTRSRSSRRGARATPRTSSIEWEIDAYTFPLPMMASAMDAAVSPATAIAIGRLGGLACLNLEGLWTRYEDPEPIYEEIASLPDEKATRRMQELYAEPIKDELIGRRIEEIKDGRRHVERLAHAPAGRAVREARAGRGARHPRDPGHRRLGRARLEPGRAAQPEGVHPGVRHPGDRRRLRVVLDRAAPDAHGRRRRARRRRTGQRVHDPRGARGRRARRRRRSPTPRRRVASTCTRPAATAT